jgi:hypothetical protein
VSSNMLDGDYSAISPLETSSYILQAPEHQGSFGQANGRTGANPY